MQDVLGKEPSSEGLKSLTVLHSALRVDQTVKGKVFVTNGVSVVKRGSSSVEHRHSHTVIGLAVLFLDGTIISESSEAC